jgi:Formyl transferase
MSNDAPPVDPLIREAELNHRLTLDRPGRRFVPIAGSRWGELILPAPDEVAVADAGGLRVVLFASFEFGYVAIEAVNAYARRFPGRVQLVGLVTDDPMNPEARIGLKKRVWKHMAREEIVAIETVVAEAALAVGVPVFTGEIKTDGFRTLLDDWQPDTIISCVFGQVIDRAIIERPAYGIYNFHPTDLAHGFGAGPTPAEDLAARGLTSTVWTIHHVIEAVDAGGIVAVSPSINVADAGGKLPADPLIVYDKLVEPVGCLAACLVDALWRRFETGQPGRLEHLEVEGALSETVKQHLEAPIRADAHSTALPAFDVTHLERFR